MLSKTNSIFFGTNSEKLSVKKQQLLAP